LTLYLTEIQQTLFLLYKAEIQRQNGHKNFKNLENYFQPIKKGLTDSLISAQSSQQLTLNQKLRTDGLKGK